MIKRVPAGIVLVVAPWNYPYLTAVNSIAPALLAGNAVILKHAAQTILVGERFQAAMDGRACPRACLQASCWIMNPTARMIALPRRRSRQFHRLGRRRPSRSSAPPPALSRRSGSNSAARIPPMCDADAPFEFAVENLVDGAFFNSGQCCCGIERIYVHESLYKRLRRGFRRADLAATMLGNPLEEETTLGPMAATAVRRDRARSYRRGRWPRARRRWSTAPGFPPTPHGTPYLMPQVLTGVDHSMQVMMEESFGPVVGIMKVESDEEAIRLMNDSPYGLTASIWTSDDRGGGADRRSDRDRHRSS